MKLTVFIPLLILVLLRPLGVCFVDLTSPEALHGDALPTANTVAPTGCQSCTQAGPTSASGSHPAVPADESDKHPCCRVDGFEYVFDTTVNELALASVSTASLVLCPPIYEPSLPASNVGWRLLDHDPPTHLGEYSPLRQKCALII